MDLPDVIPPEAVDRFIAREFGESVAASTPREIVHAKGLACRDVQHRCRKHYPQVSDYEAFYEPLRAVPAVRMIYSRVTYAVGHPVRKEVVTSYADFGLWAGRCPACGTVYLASRKL